MAAATLLLAAAAYHCGSDSSDSTKGFEGDYSNDSPNSEGPSGRSGSGVGGQPGVELPKEREVESSFTAPVATGKFVWVANPRSGRVAYIDASTFAIQVVNAGNQPTYLAAVPSPTDDVAIVLNTASSDATLLHANAAIKTRTFQTHHDANAWKISDDGHWAIAWSNWQQIDKPPRTEGYQSITVIDLSEQGKATTLTVGYRPVAVGFGKGGRAYVVTQDGVSIIDLTAAPAPMVLKNVPLSDDPTTDPGSRDVLVTPDGTLALVRRDGSPVITVVELESGKRVEVTLGADVTDLDLVPDGSRAIAVVRESSSIALLPLPAIAGDPTAFTTVEIPHETVGSVAISASGTAAMLFTNAVAVERIVALDLAAPAPVQRAVRLWAPVLAAFPTRNGESAVVLHDVSKVDTDAGPRPGGAFSLVPIRQDLPARIVSTDAPLTAVALTNAGDRAVLAERKDSTQTFAFYLATLPSLVQRRVPLASPPIAVGIVEGARRAFVAQSHPEGRITFADLDSDVVRTLTGFEVNARIEAP